MAPKLRTDLLGLPTETLQHIIELGDLEEVGAASILSTCKRLREAGSRFHFRTLEVDVDRPSQLELLRARANEPFVASAVRQIIFSTQSRPQEIGSSLTSAIVYAIKKMSGLETISLPPWLLNGSVLAAIRSLPRTGSANRPVRVELAWSLTRTAMPSFAAMASTPPTSSPSPIVFEVWIQSTSEPDDLVFGLEFLSYLRRNGDIVDFMQMQFVEPLIPPLLLDPALLPYLSSVVVSVDANSAGMMLPWVDSIPQHLPSVTDLFVALIEYEEPFNLTSEDRWVGSGGSATNASVGQFLQDWEHVDFGKVGTTRQVRSGTISFVNFSVLERDDALQPTIIRPPMLVSFNQVFGAVTHIILTTNIWTHSFVWEDWNATLPAFNALSSLEKIELGCTFTPSRTLGVVVGCSSKCTKVAYKFEPSLKSDLSLVGGDKGLRNLETHLNVTRLERLGSHLPASTEVSWIFGVDEEPIAHFRGYVVVGDDGGRTLSMRERGERIESWTDVDAKPRCLVCDEQLDKFEDIETPFDRLRACPVEEVRQALAHGGMDLVAFDSKRVAQNETPFKRFLRSGAPVVVPPQVQGV